jgi:arabinofuranosyltransferase
MTLDPALPSRWLRWRPAPRFVFFAALAAWTVFAVRFIWRTSHLAVDGTRYFTVFDDGMISMRFARNLVRGQGLSWNVGERVEGFTNPLWTLLMAAAIRVAGERLAPLLIQLLGLTLCAALFCWFHAKGLKRSRSERGVLLATLLLMTSYPLSYWSLAGMEAGAVCALFCVAALGELGAVPLAGLTCIAYLLRPDGWVAIAPFLAARLFDELKSRRLRAPLLAAGLIALVAGGSLALRHWYYGEWVPNTYVLKVVGYGLPLRLANGVGFASLFVQENAALLALVALGCCTRSRLGWLNAAAVACVLGYQIFVGGDPWLLWRQLLPIYCAAAIAVVLLTDQLAGQAQSLLAPRALLALGLCAALQGNLRYFSEIVHGTPQSFAVQAKMIDKAIAARELLPPGSSHHAFWAGTYGALVDGPVIDALGKSDAYIARLPVDRGVSWSRMSGVPGHAKYDLERTIVRARPDVLPDYLAWGRQSPQREVEAGWRLVRWRGIALCIRRDLRIERADVELGECRQSDLGL